MIRRHKAFTLAELVVVMGIIVLFIAMAVPTVRVLTGSSSIAMARNNISALLARAREEAVAMQDVRGVMFYVDPTSNRIMGVIVQDAAIQDLNLSPYTTGNSLPLGARQAVVLLDAVPNREVMTLPMGVRLQMIFSGVNPVKSAASTDDRYLGFNPIGGGSPPVLVGGAVLFDGDGKLISRPYGFQLSTGNGTVSNLAILLGMPTWNVNQINCQFYNKNNYSMSCVPGYIGNYSTGAPSQPANLVTSQLAMILFDYDAFTAQGYNDADADMQQGDRSGPGGTQGYTTNWSVSGTGGDGNHSEANEELWLDTNSTPLMINRYDGTLIRGE